LTKVTTELTAFAAVVIGSLQESSMADTKIPVEKKPGEKPEGKYHYNPVGMSGKSSEVPEDQVEQEKRIEKPKSRDEL
jgi:hypothetical protein